MTLSSTSSGPRLHHYRIAKFDPAASAAERASEWTSISDVGKRFGDELLTQQGYESVEQKYLRAVQAMMTSSRVQAVGVSEVLWTSEDKTIAGVEDGAVLAPAAVVEVCRAELREELSCHLEAPDGFAIDVGFDFYLYVTSPMPLDDVVEAIRAMGLFVEYGIPSPYHIE